MYVPSFKQFPSETLFLYHFDVFWLTKTEILLIKTRQRQVPSNFSVTFDGATLVPSAKARILGIIIDAHLTWEAHVSFVMRRCYATLRGLKTGPSCHELYHCVGRLWYNSEEARTENFKSMRSCRVLCSQIRACLPTTWGAPVGVSRQACVSETSRWFTNCCMHLSVCETV